MFTEFSPPPLGIEYGLTELGRSKGKRVTVLPAKSSGHRRAEQTLSRFDSSESSSGNGDDGSRVSVNAVELDSSPLVFRVARFSHLESPAPALR